MPIFIDARKIKEISLLSLPESKIVIYDSLLAGDIESIPPEANDFEKGLKLLSRLIKDWNLTDEQGNKLPIEETLRKFTIEDITFLLEQSDVGKSLGRKGGK